MMLSANSSASKTNQVERKLGPGHSLRTHSNDTQQKWGGFANVRNPTHGDSHELFGGELLGGCVLLLCEKYNTFVNPLWTSTACAIMLWLPCLDYAENPVYVMFAQVWRGRKYAVSCRQFCDAAQLSLLRCSWLAMLFAGRNWLSIAVGRGLE
jgi:hypothetical protein